MPRWILVTIVIGFLWVDLSIAEDKQLNGGDCDPWISKVVSLQGQVEVRRSSRDRWQPVRMEDTLCQGDRLFVGKNSRAAIVLYNQSVIRIDQGTTIVFHGVDRKKTFLMQLLQGAAHFFSHKAHSLKFLTPFVNGVVEGTEFLVQVDQEKTSIALFEGWILARNDAGDILLAKGQSAVAYDGQPPRSEMVVRPRDAVHWALYYPPILTLKPESFAEADIATWTTKVKKSLKARRQGNLKEAFTHIDGLGDGIDDPRFFLYRAALLVSVGRTMAAAADLDRVLTLDAANSDAIALRSIIAVVQNRKFDALTDAKRAVDLDPHAVAARLALSYAYQARFDLDSAYRETLEATKRGPDHAMAWARLAELRLCAGDLKGALKAAQRAVALDATLTRTQTVLGYAYLTQVNIKEAKQAFANAIEIDSSAPLPRLGMGLAKIRKGDLNGGRAELEIAAGLDPGNSLLRSYLGKAYFDEKRGPLDGQQLEMAKTLDPQDPTPWYYDAIRKQTINRPLEALQDLQTSIALNSNRAVYRSRLLLDEDLAARSASLGRIYNELGFEELGLRQGWNSLNTNPSNYSAHRLLADNYASRPRHQIARVSELLQSQLLQPLILTPVQPQLAETDLAILDQAGVSEVTFNEFNNLFARNKLRLQANGIAGSNDTLGDEVILSGIWDRISYSLGQFHYETDGFRDNNDKDQRLYNAYVQARLGPLSSIQAEYRHTDTTKGDLALRFDPTNFSSSQREETKTDRLRLGGRFGLSPESTIIGSFIYQSLENHLNRELTGLPGSSFKNEFEPDSYLSELQHMYRPGPYSLTTGIGYLKDEGDEITEIDFNFPLFPNPPDVEAKREDEHTNAYAYLKIHAFEDIDITVGASADFFGSDRAEDRDQVNPKLGAGWQILPDTRIRAAAFRSLKRTLNANQTIEPTQVAGFNQFFDDPNSTDVWRYGAAVDHAFSNRLFVGAEFSQRDLDVSFFDAVNKVVKQVNWTENLGIAYLYWMPLDWLSLSSKYQYEVFDRDRDFGGVQQIQKVETHRFPLGISAFLPNGFSGKIKATYIVQDGEFFDPSNPVVIVEGDDQFLVVDMELSYRFPKRYGIISVGAKNIFDQEFKFQDTDPDSPIVQPDPFFYFKVTLSL
jgi:tetratricopeptide (TPR) repeat protein